MMRVALSFAIILSVCWPQFTIACEPQPGDNALLAQILRLDYDDGSFAVVYPMATLGIFSTERPRGTGGREAIPQKEIQKDIQRQENLDRRDENRSALRPVDC